MRRPDIGRLLYWLATGVGSLVVTAVSLSFARSRPVWLHESFADQPDLLRLGAAVLASAVAVWVLSGLFTPRRGQLSHWWRHPPYWLAVWSGIAAAGVCDAVWGLNPKGFRVEWWHWPLCGVVPFAAAVAIRWDHQKNLSAEAEPAKLTVDQLLSTPAVLEAWVREERESAYDLLGTRRLAGRLAERLAGDVGSVGLVGPFGSGKSTVVGWMTAELTARRPKVLVCQVSCWGFEDAGGAVRRILREAVKTVGREVDCFNFRHLPEDYRQTFTAGGTWVRAVGDLVLGAPDPDEQFTALAHALEAADAKLVIVVDDLDRATGSRFDPQEVLGLLERLRKHRRRVKFVLSGSRTADFDFARLCEHIEVLPLLTTEQTARIVFAFRSQMLAAHLIDVCVQGAEDEPWRTYRYGLMGRTANYLSPPEAVATLLRTPRALKLAIRRAGDAWVRLHGEIDIDQLLEVEVLRAGAPEAFAFLLEEADRLSDDPRVWRSQEDQIDRHRVAVRRGWKEASGANNWDARSALELILQLFPAAGQYLEVGTRASNPHRRQGVAEAHGRYWRRAVSGELDDPADTDQPTLRAMQAWLEDPIGESELVRLLETSPAAVAVFERFATDPRWSSEHGQPTLNLARQLLDRVDSPTGVRAGSDQCATWFDTLRRLTVRTVTPAESVEAWVIERQQVALSVSMSLVNRLANGWSSERLEARLLPGGRARVREQLLVNARAALRTGADMLCVTHPTDPADLYRLVFPTTDREFGPSGYRGPDHWTWLGTPVLEALRSDPSRMALRVGYLLTADAESNPADGQVRCTGPELLTAFFGEDAGEVVRLLAAERDRSTGDAREQPDGVLSTLPPPSTASPSPWASDSGRAAG